MMSSDWDNSERFSSRLVTHHFNYHKFDVSGKDSALLQLLCEDYSLTYVHSCVWPGGDMEGTKLRELRIGCKRLESWSP